MSRVAVKGRFWCWHWWQWAMDFRAKWCLKCGREILDDQPMKWSRRWFKLLNPK